MGWQTTGQDVEFKTEAVCVQLCSENSEGIEARSECSSSIAVVK